MEVLSTAKHWALTYPRRNNGDPYCCGLVFSIPQIFPTLKGKGLMMYGQDREGRRYVHFQNLVIWRSWPFQVDSLGEDVDYQNSEHWIISVGCKNTHAYTQPWVVTSYGFLILALPTLGLSRNVELSLNDFSDSGSSRDSRVLPGFLKTSFYYRFWFWGGERKSMRISCLGPCLPGSNQQLSSCHLYTTFFFCLLSRKKICLFRYMMPKDKGRGHITCPLSSSKIPHVSSRWKNK